MYTWLHWILLLYQCSWNFEIVNHAHAHTPILCTQQSSPLISQSVGRSKRPILFSRTSFRYLLRFSSVIVCGRARARPVKYAHTCILYKYSVWQTCTQARARATHKKKNSFTQSYNRLINLFNFVSAHLYWIFFAKQPTTYCVLCSFVAGRRRNYWT